MGKSKCNCGWMECCPKCYNEPIGSALKRIFKDYKEVKQDEEN